ncbi:hypothetical protein CEB3_c43930 [Peptococcaceae bacterium CEB3]|nr:hypothetical protein CEB3_c43930 [Peptococcaceae bacterium CEB3]
MPGVGVPRGQRLSSFIVITVRALNSVSLREEHNQYYYCRKYTPDYPAAYKHVQAYPLLLRLEKVSEV